MPNSRIRTQFDQRLFTEGGHKLRRILPITRFSVSLRSLYNDMNQYAYSLSRSNSCLVLQSPLIDGSPCGYGGHCYNQTCQSGNTGDTIESWIDQNLQIAIPVIVVGSLLVSTGLNSVRAFVAYRCRSLGAGYTLLDR